MQSVGPKAEGWQPACRRRYIDTEPLVGRSDACSHPLSGAGTARAAGTLPAEEAEGQGAAAELDRRWRVAKKGKVAIAPPRLRSDCPQEHKAKRAARRANVLASCMRIFRFSSSRAQDGLSGRKRTLDPASSCLLLVSPPPPPRLRTNPLANAWSKASTSRTSRDQRLERVY